MTNSISKSSNKTAIENMSRNLALKLSPDYWYKKNLSYEFTAQNSHIAHTFLLLFFLIMSTTINFNSWHNNVIREGLKNNSTTTRWSKLNKLNSNFSFELILLSSPNIGRCQCWPRVVTVRSLPISSGTWHTPH